MILLQAQMKMDRRTTRSQKASRINYVLRIFGMADIQQNTIAFLSGGEKRKLNIASEFLTDPHFIFCDEPTTGLDSYNAIGVVKLFKNLITAHDEESKFLNVIKSDQMNYNKKQDIINGIQTSFIASSNYSAKAIVCSIHQPSSDIFQCFTHIILMNEGRIVYQGSTEEANIFFSK